MRDGASGGSGRFLVMTEQKRLNRSYAVKHLAVGMFYLLFKDEKINCNEWRYYMELTVIVVDKYGNELSDKELKNKVIDIQAYYDLVLPIRKRINDELFRERKKATI